MTTASRQRVIVSELTTERPTATTRIEADSDIFTTLVASIVRPAWSYRTELGLIAIVATLWTVLALVANTPAACVVTIAMVAITLRPVRVRQALGELAHRGDLRRRFDQACRYAAVVTMNDRTPRITSQRRTPAGDVLTVVMPPSLSTIPLVDAAETVAAGLGVREVRVERDANRADVATVSIIRRDPLAEQTPLAWPQINKPRLSMWKPIPVGIDELGETVVVSLVERNLMCGGEPGAGKSVSMSMLTATAALDPTCELFLIDGKQVELAVWAQCARATVGPDIDDAIDVLRLIQGGMNERYQQLLDAHKRKITPDDEMPLQVVVCDELAYYLTMGDRNQVKEFATLSRDIVARGRAAGIIKLDATQKPSHEIIPTSLRDLYAFRWALRCTTPQASDTILGAGWASQDYSAATIDPACRGVGYLLAEGGIPVRMRSFHLTDDDLVALADRAHQLRSTARRESVTDITTAA